MNKGFLRRKLSASVLLMLGVCAGNVARGQYTISTFAGSGAAGLGDGGSALAAEISQPTDIAFDASGNLYIADYFNNRIRKVSTSGIISTIAGTGTEGFSGDGGAATAAELNLPMGVAVDGSGNIYISDSYNNRIRKVNTSGIISTIAGDGTESYSGDGGPATASEMDIPYGILADASGNVYFSDRYNWRVRKISTSGTITTIAGGGSSGLGDGGAATDAEIAYPSGLARDASGNLYIGEYGRARVRKVDTYGNITTVAGNGSTDFAGDGGPATAASISEPTGIAVDASGNIYFGDFDNQRMRKVSATGIISSIAGVGYAGFTTDSGAALTAPIHGPGGVQVDSHGNVYFCDEYNGRVRKLTPGATTTFSLAFSGGSAIHLNMCANFLRSNIDQNLGVLNSGAGTTLTWSLVSAPRHGTASLSYSTVSRGGVMKTSGCWYTPTDGPGNDTFKVRVTDGTDSAITTVYIAIRRYPVAPTVSSAATAICVGGSTTLTGTPSGGSWYRGTTNVSYTTAGVVTGISNGLAKMNYKIDSGGCSNSTDFYLPVDAVGVVNNIVGGTTVCVGSMLTVSDYSTGGTWSSSNTSLATVSGGVISGVSAGTVTISYAYTNGCGVVNVSRRVTVSDIPNAGTLTGPSSVAPGGHITLAPSVAGGVFSSSALSVATVSGTGVVTGVFSGFTFISYVVTNSCGTNFVTKSINVTEGREDGNNNPVIAAETAASMKVFPNPTTGMVTIAFTGRTTDATIVLTDMSGKMITSLATDRDSADVNMTGLAAGVYLLRVSYNGNTYNEKIVVE